MQACQNSQQQLLRLHNIISHPALSSCFTEQHHAAYSAAVQAFAPAVLKVRSSGRHGRTGAKGTRSASTTSGPSNAAAAAAAAAAAGDAVAEDGAVKLAKPGGYSLLPHLQTLAVAAQETSRLVQQVGCKMEHTDFIS
jgi:hypothetical protein